MTIIYKICPAAAWREAEAEGLFRGYGVDLSDGFIHFSTARQVEETAAKHFTGLTGLVLVAVEETRLGAALRHETSRGGDLFPHLYEPLALSAVVSVTPLDLGADGRHIFPALAA